jgi:hypothetical protein
LGLGEFEAGAVAGEGVEEGGDFGVVVADFGGDLDGAGEAGVGPVGLGEVAVVAEEVVVVADDDALLGGVDVDDVDGASVAAAEALALADGVEFEAV